MKDLYFLLTTTQLTGEVALYIGLERPNSSGAANVSALSCARIIPHTVNLAMVFQNAAGGILGVVGGMLVETVLFIIRSSSKELASSVPKSKKVQ